jgi:hypothetical protein
MILEGKRVYQGLTRHARDAQSMLNFGMTQQATQLALSPRAPWVMAEGQDEGYQADVAGREQQELVRSRLQADHD